MTEGEQYRFERIVFGLSIVFVAVPFLGPWIVGSFPGPEIEGDSLRGIDVVLWFLFAVLLGISSVINLAVFVVRRKPFWHKPLPRSVAVQQVILFSLVAAWLLTQLLTVTILDRDTTAYYFLLAEAVTLGVLSFTVFVNALRVTPWEILERLSVPIPQASEWEQR